MNEPLLKAQYLVKSYPQGQDRLEVLKSVSMQIHARDAVCIVGQSGSGKSTLLHILGTLDRPDRGELSFEGKDLLRLSDEELAHFRNQKMGFVFQFHHLMSEFTAVENIMLPAQIAGLSRKEARDKALFWLSQMNVSQRADHYPSQLSGGELQRVAIARALVNQPKILFADEPTGNLDSQNALQMQNLFFHLKDKFGVTLVVVTHDMQFAYRFPKVYKMKDGFFTV